MAYYTFVVDQRTRSVTSLTGETTEWRELQIGLVDLDSQGSISVAEFTLTKDDLLWLLNDGV